MKRLTVMVFALLTITFTASAEKTAGPKGGRLLEKDGLRAEFVIEPDRNVSVTFYDEKLNALPATTESAAVVAEAPSGRKKIDFSNKNGVLVSKEPLPEGEGYNVVLQLKKDDAAKAANFRIPLETSTCSGCGRAEYACSCDH